jgi:hypothetical protein
MSRQLRFLIELEAIPIVSLNFVHFMSSRNLLKTRRV